MPKVLVTDKLNPDAIQLLKERGIAVEEKPGLSPAELKSALTGVDGLIVRTGTKVTAELLSAAPNLKVVGRAGVGLENVDVAACSAHGVVVMHTPFANAITTAEHAIALMFALARDIPRADASTRAGKWERARFTGVQMAGQTLGLIGVGNIGAVVASRAQALKVRVIAFDPFLSADRAAELHVEKVELPELLHRSDFISLHATLTDATRHILNAETLAMAKRGVRVVNCARGGLVDEVALKAAIESGQVAGAALDVFEVEPATDNPLFALDQVVVTPHLGAATAEAQDLAALRIADQVAEYLTAGAVVNAVNMPQLTAKEAEKLKPYVALAEQLGSFAGQLTDSAIDKVTVEYHGAVAMNRIRVLTDVALHGLLAPVVEGVNMVNAREVAHSRRIQVVELKNDRATDYHTMIRVTVTTDKLTKSVAGTLFGGDKPRLVEIKGIPIEAELGSHMLYVTNQDKPGFIGRLGTLLGEHQVNIATFHLGRNQAGGDAIALVQVDQPLTSAILDAVRALPHVVQAKGLTF